MSDNDYRRGYYGKVSDAFVVRVASLSAELLVGLGAPRTTMRYEALRLSEDELERGRDAVSAALWRAVGVTTDQSVRRGLLAARRSLFNGRPVTTSPHLLHDLSSAEVDLLRGYERAIQRRAEEFDQLKRTLSEERIAARRHLDFLTTTSSVARGLALSSESLAFASHRYRGVVARSNELVGTNARLERGLLRYALRAVAKATPFGTFCTVMPGVFAAAVGARQSSYRIEGNYDSVRIEVEINKAVYGLVAAALLSHPDVQSTVPLLRERPLAVSETEFVYLSSARRIEVFSRVGRSPVLEIALKLLDDPAIATLSDFVKALGADDRIGADPEQVRQFAQHLIGAGVIRPSLCVPPQEREWDVTLTRCLQGLGSNAAMTTVNLCRTLRAVCKQLPSASVVGFRALLSEADERLRESLSTIGIRSPHPIPAIRVDALGSGRAVVEAGADCHEMQDNIAEYVASTLPLAAPRAAQATMRLFFDMQYEASASISVLRFYEDYYRLHFKEHLTQLQQAAQKGEEFLADRSVANPFESSLIDDMLAANQAISDLVLNAWRNSPSSIEICLSLKAVADCVGTVSTPSAKRSSVAIMGAMVTDPLAGIRFVGKSLAYTGGFGRLYGRWLQHLPGGLLASLQEEYSSLPDDTMFAEIWDDGNHNANIHPEVLGNRLLYPGTDCVRRDADIVVDDLLVSRDPSDRHGLVILHQRSGRRVLPVDLGLLSPDLRPPLYRLLADFGPPSAYSIPLPGWLSYIGDGTGTRSLDHGSGAFEPYVNYRPRVVCGRLVIGRRRWVLTQPTHIARLPTEDVASYYMRLRNWQERSGIPLQSYVHVEGGRPVLRGGATGAMLANQQGRLPVDRSGSSIRAALNDRKPQYIDLESPFASGLLDSAARRADEGVLVFEEAYPTVAQLPGNSGRPYVTEAVLQVELSRFA